MEKWVKDEVKRVKKEIIYIAFNGCSKLKCKNCCLREACDHHPNHSKDFALKLVQEGVRRNEVSNSRT